MKLYKSIEEGTWTTPNTYSFTAEELELLNSQDPANEAAIEALKITVKEYLAANPNGEITEDELTTIEALYAQHKPELVDAETYKLIDVVIFSNTNQDNEVIYSGLINCRVAKGPEHYDNQRQIRF
jgi:hypothetical protein